MVKDEINVEFLVYIDFIESFGRLLPAIYSSSYELFSVQKESLILSEKNRKFIVLFFLIFGE